MNRKHAIALTAGLMITGVFAAGANAQAPQTAPAKPINYTELFRTNGGLFRSLRFVYM